MRFRTFHNFITFPFHKLLILPLITTCHRCRATVINPWITCKCMSRCFIKRDVDVLSCSCRDGKKNFRLLYVLALFSLVEKIKGFWKCVIIFFGFHGRVCSEMRTHFSLSCCNSLSGAFRKVRLLETRSHSIRLRAWSFLSLCHLFCWMADRMRILNAFVRAGFTLQPCPAFCCDCDFV